MMTSKQIKICEENLEYLKSAFIETQHPYTPLNVLYVKTGRQDSKKVLMRCNRHKDKNGNYYEGFKSFQDAFRMLFCCPDCLIEHQIEISRKPLDFLQNKLQNSDKKIISENHYIIDYVKNDRGNVTKLYGENNVVELGCKRLNHNEPFTLIVSQIGKVVGCVKCSKKRDFRKFASDYILDAEILLKFYSIDKLFYYNNVIERVEGKVIARIKLQFICKLCNGVCWGDMSRIDNLNCKKCNPRKSKGERKIQNFLLSNKIKFEAQKRFKGCKNSNTLPFDFYLPKYNLLIEFDGKQHYESIPYLGGEIQFLKTLTNDKIKNEYCAKNKIDLLRIPYFEEYNISEVISKKIFQLSNISVFKNFEANVSNKYIS